MNFVIAHTNSMVQVKVETPYLHGTNILLNIKEETNVIVDRYLSSRMFK